jgi:hypothetical protein
MDGVMAAAPPLDPDPPLDPKPPWLGLLGTLQNVAVISSSQITPLLGSCDVFVWPPAPSGCCGDCAATGDAKSSSNQREFLHMRHSFFAGPSSTGRCVPPLSPQSVFIVGPARGILERRGLVGAGLPWPPMQKLTADR